MELLSDFDPADQVGQLLRVIRTRSVIYCRSVMGAPWGFGVQAHGHPAFHVVTAGRCWLEVDGQPGQIPLAAGDLVVLPLGNRHWMRDAPGTAVTELEEILTTTPLDAGRRLRYGGSGPATGLLCGGFAVENGPAHPILRALPPAVVIRGTRGQPAAWLSATLEMLTAETAADAPGAQEVVTRLADVLLTQALRVALRQLGSSGGAGLLALRDRQIAAAIRLIHAQPEHAWTIGELAGRVALSRSAFSARFRDLVGESPCATSPAPAWPTQPRCCVPPTPRSPRSPPKPDTGPNSPSARPSSAPSASRPAHTADSPARRPSSSSPAPAGQHQPGMIAGPAARGTTAQKAEARSVNERHARTRGAGRGHVITRATTRPRPLPTPIRSGHRPTVGPCAKRHTDHPFGTTLSSRPGDPAGDHIGYARSRLGLPVTLRDVSGRH